MCTPRLYGPSAAEARARFAPGQLSGAAGQAAYDAIVAAVADARTFRIDAIATAPVNKEAFSLAGLPWKGHTDLLGHLTGVARPVMFFHAERLKVALATVHIALADVAQALTPDVLASTIRTTADALPGFGIARPRLAVAGLNPHCGEHGLMGHEDDRVVAPVVASLARPASTSTGPIPGDTVFVRATRGEFDAVVACYHDQGLIPVKLLAFGSAVNVTLGLPIIRTSVDHGTAFDIAGQDRADASSLVEAVVLAARLARAEDCMAGIPVPPPRPQRAKPPATKPEPAGNDALLADNRKARFDYEILETFEAGMVLLGTEVKAIREGRVNLRDSYAVVEKGEVFALNIHISPYSHRGYADHEPMRKRKLLLHKQEIRKLIGRTVEKGLTLVPLKMYFKSGKVKMAIGLARGKKSHDKRETIKKREADRETRAAVKERQR